MGLNITVRNSRAWHRNDPKKFSLSDESGVAFGFGFDDVNVFKWRCSPVGLVICEECLAKAPHTVMVAANTENSIDFLSHKLQAHYSILESTLLAYDLEAWAQRFTIAFRGFSFLSRYDLDSRLKLSADLASEWSGPVPAYGEVPTHEELTCISK